MPIGSPTSNIHHAESRQENKPRSDDIEIDSDRLNKLDAIENKKSPNPVGLKLNKTVYLKEGIASKGLYSGSTGLAF
jgi:hypothetical protein